MPILRTNSTNYTHPWEPNLADLHTAMKYNSDGEPVIRTHVDGISLQGDVIVDTVSLSSSTLAALESINVQNNVTATITSLPAITGIVTVSNFTSTIQVSNFTSTVTVSNFPTSVTVTNFTSTVQVSNNVSATITSLPPVTVTGTITTVPSNTVSTLVKYIDSTNIQMDMTERLRVAPPTQSWWYAPTVDKDGDLRYIEAITGTNASSVFVQNLASIRLSPGSASNGSVIRISRRRHKMRPGVSIQYLASLSFHGKRTNVTKQAGMFTNFNGIFYEVSGGTLWVVVRRRLTDGTLVEHRTERANFNYDKLDGTGESGFDFTTSLDCNLTSYVSKSTITINTTTNEYCYNVVFGCDNPSIFAVGSRVGVSGVSPVTYNTSALVQSTTTNTVTLTYVVDPGVYTSMSSATLTQTAFHKQYVYGFDFSGSRTTRVRFFMDTPKGKTVLHIEEFAGALSTSFENAPALSTRYQIFNTGSVDTCAAMTVSSEAVNVEAELELNPGFGVAHNLAHPVTFIKQNAGTEWAIMAVGLRAGEPYQRADLQIQGLQIADKGNVNPQNSGLYYWRLVLNPTVVGTMPTPINVGKASRKWEFTGTQTISGGTELMSGIVTSVSTIDTRTALNFINLGSNIDYSDADKIVLSVQQVVGGTDNGSIIATINFIESL